MLNNTQSKPVGPILNNELGLYEMRMGDIILESNSDHVFYLRFHELKKIAESIIPENIKFVIYDETLYEKKNLVSVKLILEKLGTDYFQLKVEMSSKKEDWKNESGIGEFFKDQYEKLMKRQQSAFDLIVDPLIDYSDYYFQSNSFSLNDYTLLQIFEVSKEIVKNIHKNSRRYNSIAN